MRDRTLALIRRAHLITAPLAVGGLILFVPEFALIAVGLFYLTGMALVIAVLRRRWQATALAVFDLLLISYVSAADAAIWTGLLIPAVSAMTIGWLVSPRATWVLWLVGCTGMGVANLFADPPGGLYVVAVLFGSTASLNFNNLKILGEGRDSVLRVADLVQSLPVIVWEADVETMELTRAVGRVPELLGYSVTEWRDMPVDERVHPDDLDRYRLGPVDVADAEVREVRLRRADGSSLLVREVVRSVVVAERAYLRGVVLDIAEEAAARVEVDRLAAVVANQAEPLSTTTWWRCRTVPWVCSSPMSRIESRRPNSSATRRSTIHSPGSRTGRCCSIA